MRQRDLLNLWNNLSNMKQFMRHSLLLLFHPKSMKCELRPEIVTSCKVILHPASPYSTPPYSNRGTGLLLLTLWPGELSFPQNGGFYGCVYFSAPSGCFVAFRRAKKGCLSKNIRCRCTMALRRARWGTTVEKSTGNSFWLFKKPRSHKSHRFEET